MSDELVVSVEPDVAQVVPGEPAHFQIRAVNNTTVVDQYAISAVGFPQEWLQSTPTEMSLFPGSDGLAQVQIIVPPAGLPAGSHTLGIKITSEHNPRVSRVEEIELSIEPITNATMTVTPQTVRGGGGGKVHVTVRNDGNHPVAVRLQGHDPEAVVNFQCSPPVLTVPPGSEDRAAVQFSAPRPFVGEPTTRQLTISDADPASSLESHVSFEQRPRISAGAMRLVGSVLSVALIGGIAWLLLGKDNSNGSSGEDNNDRTEVAAAPSESPEEPANGSNGSGETPSSPPSPEPPSPEPPSPEPPSPEPVPAELEFNPLEINFGLAGVGEEEIEELELRAVDGEELTIESVALESEINEEDGENDRSIFGFENGCANSLNEGDTCIIQVTYEPIFLGQAQEHNDFLVVETTDDTARVELRGRCCGLFPLNGERF